VARTVEQSIAEWSFSSLTPGDRQRWEQLVAAHPRGTLYHLPGWSELLYRCYGFQPICLALVGDANQIGGILPLSLIDSPLTGRRLVSLPFTNAVGPLGENEATASLLLQHAVELAGRERCRYVEIRGTPERDCVEVASFARHDYYGTFLLDLTGDGKGRLPSIDKRARRGIVRAARDGVVARFLDDDAAPRAFFQLNLITRRKHGVPPQPLRYFEALWSTLRPGGHVQILVAELAGQRVASIVLTAYKDTVTYAYGASDPAYLRHSPNHALFDAAIGWALERGYRYFDFGRTAPDNAGLMEFKRQWGAAFLPLPYYYWPNRDGFVSEAEASWKHRLFTSLWRRLPLPATAVLGPPLYRHLA
jgi:FemAB-related protein (PEP-CTERM system-associated)